MKTPHLKCLGIATAMLLAAGSAHAGTIVYDFTDNSTTATTNTFDGVTAGDVETVVNSGQAGVANDRWQRKLLGGATDTMSFTLSIPADATLDLTELSFVDGIDSRQGTNDTFSGWTLTITNGGSASPSSGTRSLTTGSTGVTEGLNTVALSGLTGLSGTDVTFTWEVNYATDTAFTGGNNNNRHAFLDDITLTGTVVSGGATFQLVITPNADVSGNYDFSWESKPSKVYDLVSDTTLETAPSTWPVWQDLADIPASGTGTTTLENVPGGGDTRRFFSMIEKDGPPLLSEDFEDNDGGFTFTTTEGTDWAWGTPDSAGLGGSVSAGNEGSTRAWGTNLGTVSTAGAEPSAEQSGFYADPTIDSCLRSPNIDLTGFTSASLTFAEALDLPAADSAVVKLINATTDVEIATVYISTDGSPNSADWSAANGGNPIDLSAGAGEIVYLQWCLSGTGGDFDDYMGWYIDDVVVTGE